MSTKRKRTVLSLKKKVEIINRVVDKSESVKKIAIEYGIGEQTVRDLIKNRKDILQFVCSSESIASCSSRKTLKTSRMVELDRAVYQWFKQKRAEGLPISGPMISEKALWFYEELKIDEPFSASQGWLSNFKKRYGIRQLEIQGESMSGDFVAATLFNENFAALKSKFNLCDEQIYNADETGLFWKMLPSKTLALQSEKSAPGHKSSKERLTVLTCSNASGTHKLKLAVIGKAKKPRSFKGTEVKSLPCDYYNHPKAWMNQAIFTAWFKEKFVPSVRDHLEKQGLPQKAVLLLDNAPSHPGESILKSDDNSIFVHYLPANVTSLIQPMDQGVISCLKRRYKKIFLRFLLEVAQKENLKEILKEWTVKDAIFAICEAWNDLPCSTLKLAWAKVLDPELDQSSTDHTLEALAAENQIDEFLAMVQSVPGFTDVDQVDMTDWLNVDENLEGYEKLSDMEIAELNKSVSSTSELQPESDSEEEILETTEEKIPHSKAIESIETLLNYFEQENADYTKILALREMRREVRNKMMKKQSKILNYFCPTEK